MSRPGAASLAESNAADALAAAFAADVGHFLSQRPRQLPSRYLYDALGSALFDAICELPWYPITRAEKALLTAHAEAILGAAPPSRIIELGAGNGSKLATLLGGMPRGRRATIHLVDVSVAALASAAQALERLGGVDVITHQAAYEDGLAQLQREARGERAMVLFLGSNIGNFDPPAAAAFLSSVRGTFNSGDRLLIGADLVKPEPELLLAYDDPLQVTAAFNRNLLVRINRELQADFDLDRFRHRALWSATESRIEMHLESTAAQRVQIGGAGLVLTFAEGERIWTESSYKYSPQGFSDLLRQCGFTRQQQWVSDEGFVLVLAEA